MTHRLETIPLFPLHVVLFPGARLPIRIFEERYKALLKDVRESKRPFGVVFIREGNESGDAATPFDVGTLVEIEAMDHKGDQTFILCRGTERFRIQRRLEGAPYQRAEIERIPNPGRLTAGQEEAARRIRASFDAYVTHLRSLARGLGGELRVPELPSTTPDTEALFTIAFSLPLDLERKQGLLEDIDFDSFLENLQRLLDAELDFLKPDDAPEVA